MNDSIPLMHRRREVGRTLISPEDFGYLSQFTWFLGHTGYVMRAEMVEGKVIKHRMHREVLRPPEGKMVDHINGDRMDNRRENLRIATAAQNIRNSKISVKNKTGYKGVSVAPYSPDSAPTWRANIRANERQTHLGIFSTPEEAARVYDSAAFYYFGEFAKLNFPTETPAPYDPSTQHVKHSPFIGVSRKRDKWRALLLHDGKQVSFGCFETELEAALAYNEGAMRLRGEAARLNIFEEAM